MLSIVVNTVAQEMEKVNDSKCITFDYEHESPPDVTWMLYFEGFYQELHNLLRIREDATKEANQTTAPPILRHRSPGTDSIISTGTYASGVSGESNKEHHTQGFARAFLLATLQTLNKPLKAAAWFSDQYEFSSSYVPIKPLLRVSGDQEMSLKLGETEIEAKSDGGVNLYPKKRFQTFYPMLSVEVIGSLLSDVDS